MCDKAESERQLVAELVLRARKAQAIAEGFSQRRVDELAAAVVYALSRADVASEIAEMAYAETGMGKIESKIAKMAVKMPGCFYDVKDQKTVGIIDYNPETGITMIAKPIGVIGALIPSTNPEATPVFKGMLGLRGRNAVVFAPHPRSKKTTVRVVELMREVLKKNGAPEDLFICIENPSKGLAAELMRQCDTVMATGSGDMVRAAYSSGKPSYGVGVGNAVIVIDETADIDDAARKIRIGKTGDNASGCSAENSLLIQKGIYDQMLAALKKEGGYLATPEEKEKLQKAMWHDGALSIDVIAQPVEKIAAAAAISVPAGSLFIMVEEQGVGPDHPFSGEKISLVLTLYRYDSFDDAIAQVNAITNYSGLGHSCGIHSFDREHIMKLGEQTRTSRVVVRQPHGNSNSGNWSNGLAFTFSLGCGTWGGNTASENITQKHYLNITRVAEPINRSEPPEKEIFGDLLDDIVL
jgi:sulfoacetaldehyde dehydrogenase